MAYVNLIEIDCEDCINTMLEVGGTADYTKYVCDECGRTIKVQVLIDII